MLNGVKRISVVVVVLIFDVIFVRLILNRDYMKKSCIKIQSYFYTIKADKWLVNRLMTLFPWLDIVGTFDGLDSIPYVTICVPSHVDSLVRPVIPKSCVYFRKKFTTIIDVYEETFS